MGGAGFEPAKAEPSDLQSDPFDRFGNPPGSADLIWPIRLFAQCSLTAFAKTQRERCSTHSIRERREIHS